MTVTAHSAFAQATPTNRGVDADASRALVPSGPVADADPERHRRGSERAARLSSGFLAHLIATRDEVPQTRARRRAKPEEACLHYDAANAAADIGTSQLIRSL